jgi:hypothetical protein
MNNDSFNSANTPAESSANKWGSIGRLFIFIIIGLLIIFGLEWLVAHQHWKCLHEQPTQSEQKSESTSQEQQTKSPILISCKGEEKEDCGCKDEENKGFVRDTYLGYVLQKIVYFTTQTSIGLMVLMFIYFTWLAYKRYQDDFSRLTKEQKEKGKMESKKYQRKLKKLEEKGISQFLTEVLVASLSISAIPTGISLMICAIYDISFIKYMSGVEIYIAFAGISILSIGFLSTLQEQTQMAERRNSTIDKPGDIKPESSNKPEDIKPASSFDQPEEVPPKSSDDSKNNIGTDKHSS